jgi:hypothetical protein
MENPTPWDFIGAIAHRTEKPFIEELREKAKAHLPTDQCPDQECLICGVRDCPHGEPLHYHHDGCPACYFDEEFPKHSEEELDEMEREMEEWANEPIPDDFFPEIPDTPEEDWVNIEDEMTPEEAEAWRQRVKDYNEREDEI